MQELLQLVNPRISFPRHLLRKGLPLACHFNVLRAEGLAEPHGHPVLQIVQLTAARVNRRPVPGCGGNIVFDISATVADALLDVVQ